MGATQHIREEELVDTRMVGLDVLEKLADVVGEVGEVVACMGCVALALE